MLAILATPIDMPFGPGFLYALLAQQHSACGIRRGGEGPRGNGWAGA